MFYDEKEIHNMTEIKINIDGYSNRILKKNQEIWGRSFSDAEMGSRSAFLSDILTGWSGFLTTTVLYHPTWKFPLWVREQTNPSSPGFIPAGFSWDAGCTFNQRYRTWTMIGLRNQDEEPIIGLDGEIMPRIDSFSVAFWVFDDSKLLAFGEEGKINQKLEEGYLPIVNTEWTTQNFLLKSKAYANASDGIDLCFSRTTILNKTNKTRNLKLFIVITPWGPDGFHPVFEIEYNKLLNCFIVDNNTGVIFNGIPESFTCMNYKDGDVCVDAFDGKLSLKEKSHCEVGYCSAAASYSFTLNPNQEKFIDFKLPIKKAKLSGDKVNLVKSLSFDKNIAGVTRDWKDFLKQGLMIKTPDKLVNETYKSALVSLHLLKDGEYTTPGPRLYHLFWIRDAAHQLKALDMVGFPKDVEEILEQFKTKQNHEGYFQNTRTDNKDEVFTMVEYDSNGQAIWAFVEHYKTIRDREWLKGFYPYIKKGAEYISKLRRITLTNENKDTLHYGLMPKAGVQNIPGHMIIFITMISGDFAG